MSLEILISISAAFLFCVPIVFSIGLGDGKKHSRASYGVINYDALCYQTVKSSGEIIACLKRPNVHDPLKYRFSPDELVITFYSALPDGFPPSAILWRLRKRMRLLF